MNTITVVLADDHHVVRKGLRALLAAEPDLSVVGEAADGRETVALVERVRPRVLVVDLMMPSLNGLEVTRQVQRRSPGTRVVVLSMYSNEAYVLEALKNGAAGYVLKGANATDLLTAVREAAAGRHYLSPPLSEQAVTAYRERASATADRYDTLTTREREVFHLIAEGCSNAQIATRLSISPRTAETHRTNLMRKLDLHSHADVVKFALHRGIVAPADVAVDLREPPPDSPA